MDQKDLMLQRARAVMQSTAEVLNKILEDDDDIVLSAPLIGDVDAEKEKDMQRENMDHQDDPIQRARQWTFKQVAQLSYNSTAADAEAFFDDPQTWIMFPGRRREEIEKRFGDPRFVPYPSASRALQLSEAMEERINKMEMVIALFENLHKVDQSSDVNARIRVSRARREAFMRKGETFEQTARRHAFTFLSELTGKPEKQIAKLFGAIDWKDRVRWDEQSQTGRFAPVYAFLFDDLPQDQFYRREPTSDAERKRRLAHTEHVRAAHQRAKDLVHPVIKSFENLRAELASWQRRQGAKAARKIQLERQIAQAQAKLKGYDQAA